MSDSEEESQNAVEQVERRAKKDAKIKAKGVVHKTEHAVFSKTNGVVETCEHGVHMTKNFVENKTEAVVHGCRQDVDEVKADVHDVRENVT